MKQIVINDMNVSKYLCGGDTVVDTYVQLSTSGSLSAGTRHEKITILDFFADARRTELHFGAQSFGDRWRSEKLLLTGIIVIVM